MTRWWSSALATWLLLAGIGECSDARAMERVLADWKARRAAFKTLRYIAEGTCIVPRGGYNESLSDTRVGKEDLPAEDHVSNFKHVLVVDFVEKRVRQEIYRDVFSVEDKRFTPNGYVTAFDGMTARARRPPDKNPSSAAFGVELYDNIDHCFIQTFDALALFSAGYVLPWMTGAAPTCFFDCSGEKSLAITDQIEYGGHTYAVAKRYPSATDPRNYDEFWIALANQSKIARWNRYARGLLQDSATISYEKTEHGDNPKAIQCAVYRAGKPEELYELHVTEFVVNGPVAIDEFRLTPSPGTVVSNEKTHKVYVAPEGVIGTRRWMLSAATLVALGVLIVFLYRRRFRRVS